MAKERGLILYAAKPYWSNLYIHTHYATSALVANFIDFRRSLIIIWTPPIRVICLSLFTGKLKIFVRKERTIHISPQKSYLRYSTKCLLRKKNIKYTLNFCKCFVRKKYIYSNSIIDEMPRSKLKPKIYSN